MSSINRHSQFNATGPSPSAYCSTNYHINKDAAVLAAHIGRLWHFETCGWLKSRNASPNENTVALEGPLSVPAGRDPIATYIRTFEYTDAVYTAVPDASLSDALPHDTGTGNVTNVPTQAVTAEPGAIVAVATDAATPTALTLGSAGSRSGACAAASLADGSCAVTVTRTPFGRTIGTTGTLSFMLDRTAPTVTAAAGGPT